MVRHPIHAYRYNVSQSALVIANPMDFATMLKKVKSKQYKSKREFKDDLELIWSNCYTYNAAEVRLISIRGSNPYNNKYQNHPLRPCVKRLKLKADRLLKYITDRKERTDPPIPSDIVVTNVARPKLNGHASNGSINGRAHSHRRSPSFPTIPKSVTPSTKPSTPLPTKSVPRRNLPFPDTPAISRTPEGMALFLRLDRGIIQASEPSKGSNNSDNTPPVLEKLQELASPIEHPGEPESGSLLTPDDAMLVDDFAGDKRKM